MAKVLVIGHSHIHALERGYEQVQGDGQPVFEFLLVRKVEKAALAAHIAQVAADVALLCLNGNEHTVTGLLKNTAVDAAKRASHLEEMIARRLPRWLDFLLPLLPERVKFCSAPPPCSADVLEGNFLPERVAKYNGMQLEPPAFRLAMWRLQCKTVRDICLRYGIEFVDPPAEVFDAAGMLARDCWSDEPNHGGAEYGRRMLKHLIEVIGSAPAVAPFTVATEIGTAASRKHPHPYAGLPDSSFWKQSISCLAPSEVDPVSTPPFTIARSDRVATAGSCFAQHISKRLRKNGFQFFVAEPGPSDGAAGEQRGYYDFSARYGNLYTARQLLQLFDRAFGYFRPIDRVWTRHGGGFCDPFRPRIEPEGFATEAAVEQDRVRHHGAVRRMFRQLDVFVFTLGLTECWVSRLDGAVYPVVPGVVGGTFEPALHGFVNFSVREIVDDIEAFLCKLKLVNPKARVILTVSPVPLVATAADRHVLVSTTYSKSVLRVAAEEISRAHSHVCYFPSYEIITGPHAAGGYFEADRRSVSEAGVDHVMRVFMRHMTDAKAGAATVDSQADAVSNAALAEMEALADAACDEEMLAR